MSVESAVVAEAKTEVPAEKKQFEAAAGPIGTLVQGQLAELPAAAKEARRGYRTSEFWLVVVGLMLTNLSIIKIPGKYGQAVTDAAAVAAYVISRGLAKRP